MIEERCNSYVCIVVSKPSVQTRNYISGILQEYMIKQQSTNLFTLNRTKSE